MQAIRRLLAQRHLAMLVCAAALLLKLLVPAGYMIGSDRGGLTIELCTGVAPQAMAMPGMHGDMPGHATSQDRGKPEGHGKTEGHGKAEMPCAFSGLSAALLAAVDPILLAALIAFVMRVAITGSALPPPSRRAHLRPPLRGPPATP